MLIINFYDDVLLWASIFMILNGLLMLLLTDEFDKSDGLYFKTLETPRDSYILVLTFFDFVALIILFY